MSQKCQKTVSKFYNMMNMTSGSEGCTTTSKIVNVFQN